MRQIDKPQRLETVFLTQDYFKYTFIDVIIGQVDVAYALHELSHSLEPSQVKPVVAQLQTLNLMDASCSVHVLNHLVAGQAAVRQVEEVRQCIL